MLWRRQQVWSPVIVGCDVTNNGNGRRELLKTRHDFWYLWWHGYSYGTMQRVLISWNWTSKRLVLVGFIVFWLKNINKRVWNLTEFPESVSLKEYRLSGSYFYRWQDLCYITSGHYRVSYIRVDNDGYRASRARVSWPPACNLTWPHGFSSLLRGKVCFEGPQVR